MTIFDYIVIGVLVLSILVGFIRGFVNELLSFLKWIAAFVAGKFLTPVVMDSFPSLGGSDSTFNYWLVFIGLAVLSYFLVTVINSWLVTIVKGLKLGGVDKLLGGVFGFLRGLIVGVIAIILLSYTPIPDNEGFRQSQTAPYLFALSLNLFPDIPDHGYSKDKPGIPPIQPIKLPDSVNEHMELLNRDYEKGMKIRAAKEAIENSDKKGSNGQPGKDPNEGRYDWQNSSNQPNNQNRQNGQGQRNDSRQNPGRTNDNRGGGVNVRFIKHDKQGNVVEDSGWNPKNYDPRSGGSNGGSRGGNGGQGGNSGSQNEPQYEFRR